MDEYASHLPVLEKALEVFKPKRILEHGCGYYSTPLFARVGVVHSTEHDLPWINKVNKIPDFPRENWQIVSTNTDILSLDVSGYDLVFVDGAREGRVPSIEHAINNRVKVIIYHDANLPTFYGYDRLIIPPWYQRVSFAHVEGGRQTVVLTLGDQGVRDWTVKDHRRL